MKKVIILMVLILLLSLMGFSDTAENNIDSKKAADDNVKVETVHYIGPDEYVVIKNTGKQPVNLEGWTLISTIGGEEYIFQNVEIKPDDTVSVHSGPEATGLVWTKDYIFYDPSDGVMLYNEQGKYISFFRWGR